MAEKDQYKSLTICSKDLDNGVYRLATPILARGVRVESAFFCNILKNVPADGYILLYVYDDMVTSGFSSYQINVPKGNYSANDFLTQVQSQIDSYLGAGKVTVSLNTTTLRVTFTYIHNSPQKYIRVGVGSYSSILPNMIHMLGFTKDMTRSTSVTSDKMINFSPRNLLHVYSRYLGSRLSDNYHSSYPNDRNIMASLHVTEAFGSWVSTLFPAPSFMSMDASGSRQLLDTIDLSIVDEYLQPVDFDNFPFYVELAFI